jgi:Protein of unknown function (DUF1286)
LKGVTHDIFSLGLCLYLAYHVCRLAPFPDLPLVVWLALATNKLIDALGHRTSRDGLPVRSFWTHSIFTAPIWCISAALVSFYLLDVLLLGQAMGAPQTLFAAGLGLVLAYSHLLLDALTEGGVFLGRKRIALAHLRYNNPILNGVFAALGLMLVFAAFI